MSAAGAARVLLTTLSGEQHAVDVDPEGFVSTVKQQVQERLGYPPESQQLLLQGAVAEEDRSLGFLPQPLRLTLVILPFDKGRALFHAASHGHEAAVRRLLFKVPRDRQERSAMLQAPFEFEHWTPLHAAAHHGDAPVCRALLEASQSTGECGLWTALDRWSSTLLHVAARSGQEEVCGALLAALPDRLRSELLVAKDVRGCTALHYAACRGSTLLCRALLEAAPALEPRCEMLLAKEKLGDTPLHLAAQSGCAAACQAILEAAPGPEVRRRLLAAPDSEGKTAVQVAEDECCAYLQSA